MTLPDRKGTPACKVCAIIRPPVHAARFWVRKFWAVLANGSTAGRTCALFASLRKCPPWLDFEGGKMLDELKEEAIVNKVGGRFKLSTLIQKRMKALNSGARPLVKVRGGDQLAIVIQEILQDKIYLDLSGQLQTYAPS